MQITLVFDIVHVLLLNQICIRCASVLSFARLIDPVFCSLKRYPGCPLDLFSPQRSPVRNLGPGGGSRQRGLMMRGGDLRPGVPTLLPHTHIPMSLCNRTVTVGKALECQPSCLRSLSTEPWILYTGQHGGCSLTHDACLLYSHLNLSIRLDLNMRQGLLPAYSISP